MIRDIAELENGSTINAQVGIVGAGLAGLDAARFLARHGLRVVVLESGRREFDPEIQKLTRVESVGKPLRTPDPKGPHNPYLPPMFRGEGRLRQLGGTANIWTGKWREFDALDFEARAWVPESGWPISLDELRPTYREIERDYAFGDFQAFADNEGYRRLCRETAPAGLQPGFHYWEGETTRPAQRYRAELEASPNLVIVLGASATELLLDHRGERVESVMCRSLDGHWLTLAADHIMVAAGGLETPRLLLASTSRFPEGIGNKHDLVGRFYTDHPKVKGGKLYPGRNFGLIPGGAAFFPRPRFQVSFTLSREEQRRFSLLNHAVFLSPADSSADPGIQALAAAWRKRDIKRLLWRAASIEASPMAVLAAVREKLALKTGASRDVYKAALCVEQAPNPSSRVYLGTERDGLGMPRLVVDWRFTERDHESFRTTLHKLAKALEAAGIGRLEFGSRPPTLDDTTDANHPMGATRMGATPASGVVDRDCKVFGIDNLFVASSSVFPTGHSVAPTLTIIALARRASARILKLSRPVVLNQRMARAVVR